MSRTHTAHFRSFCCSGKWWAQKHTKIMSFPWTWAHEHGIQELIKLRWKVKSQLLVLKWKHTHTRALSQCSQSAILCAAGSVYEIINFSENTRIDPFVIKSKIAIQIQRAYFGQRSSKWHCFMRVVWWNLYWMTNTYTHTNRPSRQRWQRRRILKHFNILKIVEHSIYLS